MRRRHDSHATIPRFLWAKESYFLSAFGNESFPTARSIHTGIRKMKEFQSMSYEERCAVVERIMRDARRARAETVAAAVRALFSFVVNGVRRLTGALNLHTARPAAS